MSKLYNHFTCGNKRKTYQLIILWVVLRTWPYAVPSKGSSHYVKGALIGVMSAVSVALLVLLVFLWVRLLSKKERDAKKYKEVYKQTRKETGITNCLYTSLSVLITVLIFITKSCVFLGTKLITFHGDLPYPSCEIIEKLESLTEEDVVGSGGYGTVYRMVMNDCGVFAVKKIDQNREGCDRDFERELEILGSVKHMNLVNLRGYCRLPIAKLFIYDYMAMGSLDEILHGMLHRSYNFFSSHEFVFCKY